MDFSLNIPKDQLVTELESKRTTLEAEYDAQVTEIQEEIASFQRVADATKDWHLKIADLVNDGLVRFNGRGEPVALDEETEVPERPSVSSQRKQKQHLKYDLENIQSQKEAALSRIDAALKLLRLAQDEAVTIPASEYERMLGETAGRGRRYWY